MTDSFKFQFNKRDARRVERLFSTTHNRRLLKREVRKATIDNSKLIKRRIRKSLVSGKYAKNAELTIAIKGSSRPLSDLKLLLSSISVTSPRWDTSKITITEKRTASGLTTFDLAKILQRGAVIPVTAKMRGMFWLLWIASMRNDSSKLRGRAAELFDRFQQWKPISPGTQNIIIPARPFMKDALSSASLKREVRRNYKMAISRAFNARNY